MEVTLVIGITHVIMAQTPVYVECSLPYDQWHSNYILLLLLSIFSIVQTTFVIFLIY